MAGHRPASRHERASQVRARSPVLLPAHARPRCSTLAGVPGRLQAPERRRGAGDRATDLAAKRPAELPEEWDAQSPVSVDQAKALLRDPTASDEELMRVAACVFAVAESDETAWDDSHVLFLAGGEEERDLQELAGIWHFVRGDRRNQLLEYAQSLRKLEDLEFIAAADAMRLDATVSPPAPRNDEGTFDRAHLERLGFEGFVTVVGLPRGRETVPASAGVYAVLRTATTPPAFLERSAGGHFKGEDPTDPLDRLRDEWVTGAATLYIGRGGNLRTRVDQLARFARGEAIGHKGGRMLWQLADHEQLLVAWFPTQDLA